MFLGVQLELRLPALHVLESLEACSQALTQRKPWPCFRSKGP